MRTYAAAQLIGSRTAQCDATATRTSPDGTIRAHALLDGIGSTATVRTWTRAAAVRLARAAVRHGDAETALRAQYAAYAADAHRHHPYTADYMPKAAAVVAVTGPDHLLSVAWCGDSRAYLLADGHLRRLTNDHNLRRVWPPRDGHGGGNRHVITSCLGSIHTDEDVHGSYAHPAIEAATVLTGPGRLLLASDGAYEPLEDTGADIADHLTGAPFTTARDLVAAAIARGGTDNATALVADLSP